MELTDKAISLKVRLLGSMRQVVYLFFSRQKFFFISELMELFVPGHNQSTADRPYNPAKGRPRAR